MAGSSLCHYFTPSHVSFRSLPSPKAEGRANGTFVCGVAALSGSVSASFTLFFRPLSQADSAPNKPSSEGGKGGTTPLTDSSSFSSKGFAQIGAPFFASYHFYLKRKTLSKVLFRALYFSHLLSPPFAAVLPDCHRHWCLSVPPPPPPRRRRRRSRGGRRHRRGRRRRPRKPSVLPAASDQPLLKEGEVGRGGHQVEGGRRVLLVGAKENLKRKVYRNIVAYIKKPFFCCFLSVFESVFLSVLIT